MTWLVWDSAGETEADAWRIDAQDCLEAAEEWARRVGDGDPMSCERHLRDGLELRVLLDGERQVCKVVIEAETVIHYHARRA